MIRDALFLNRRQLLVGSTASFTAATLGCRRSTPPTVDVKPSHSFVPLRVTMVASSEDAEKVRRGWLAVSEQPINIRNIPVDRSQAAAMFEAVGEAAKNSDLVICPMAAIAELVASESIVTLSGDEIEAVTEVLFPALRNGISRYATATYALPVGSPLPALLSSDSIDAIGTWQDYHHTVDKQWHGAACEPSAPGWAGSMFLWRAVEQVDRWLFDRDNFEPLLATDGYIDTLTQMAETCRLYQLQRQTPEQIWRAVAAGKIKGGIGFPHSRSESESDHNVFDLPGSGENAKLLLDPFASVITMSVNCRQTAVSKTFLRWLSGGDGSDAVRKQIVGTTPVRQETGTSDGGGATNYGRWLTKQLATPITQPTLQILAAGKYYASLDKQVVGCLDGKMTPQQALGEASTRWREITKAVGVDRQLRAWRRAQGMRA